MNVDREMHYFPMFFIDFQLYFNYIFIFIVLDQLDLLLVHPEAITAKNGFIMADVNYK